MRWLRLLGGALLLVLAVLCARLLLGGRAELAAAAAANQRGDAAGERRHLRRAMAHYLPGSPYVRRAHHGLLEQGRHLEASGQPAAALRLLHEHRSAILALRGLTRPYAASLPELDRRIVALTAVDPEAAPFLRSPEGLQRLQRRLSQPPEPDPFWAGLGVLGFLLWSGGALLLFLLGLRPDASLVRRRLWPLLGLVAGGLLLFVTGMAWA